MINRDYEVPNTDLADKDRKCSTIAQFTKQQILTMYFDRYPPFSIWMLYIYAIVSAVLLVLLGTFVPDLYPLVVVAPACSFILTLVPLIRYVVMKKKAVFPFFRKICFGEDRLIIEYETGNSHSVSYQKISGYSEDTDNVILFHKNGRVLLSKSRFDCGSWEEAQRLLFAKNTSLEKKKAKHRQYLWVIPMLFLMLFFGSRVLLRLWNPKLPNKTDYSPVMDLYNADHNNRGGKTVTYGFYKDDNLLLSIAYDLEENVDPVLYAGWKVKGNWHYSELEKLPHKDYEVEGFIITAYAVSDYRVIALNETVDIDSTASFSTPYQIVTPYVEAKKYNNGMIVLPASEGSFILKKNDTEIIVPLLD